MQARVDLAALFRSAGALTHVGDAQRFSVVAVPGLPGYWVGRASQNVPVLLITDDRIGPAVESTIETNNVRVLFAARCELAVGALVTSGRFTVLECRSSDPPVHTLFLEVLSTLVTWLGGSRNATDVRKIVEALVDLFRATDEPGRKTLQGLWGELFLMRQARSPLALVQAWHNTPNERYDFGVGDQRIEVKTGVEGSRLHHFRLEQLTSDSLAVAVASLQVEAVGGGTSIAELVDEIRDRLGADAAAHVKLDTLVYATLGRDWRAARVARFDPDVAAKSLLYVDARTIPKVPTPLPAGVTGVSFIADVSLGVPMTPTVLASSGGLWAAVCST